MLGAHALSLCCGRLTASLTSKGGATRLGSRSLQVHCNGIWQQPFFFSSSRPAAAPQHQDWQSEAVQIFKTQDVAMPGTLDQTNAMPRTLPRHAQLYSYSDSLVVNIQLPIAIIRAGN